jgi:hypothetical protein
MMDARQQHRFRVKVAALAAWGVVCLAVAIVIIVLRDYPLLVLVGLIAIAPVVMVTSGFWQWSNSRPNGFTDWLHR